MKDTMQAYLLEGDADSFTASVKSFSTADLPDEDVTIKVEYSSINFKDSMVNKGLGKMVRTFPHVPGIDLSGVVVSDRSGTFSEGDRVSLTGYEVGLGHFGGYSEYTRMPADWVVKLPEGLSTFEASALGTAGLTAMMAVMALETNGVRPDQGPVLVTGATGGVGAIAIELLTRAGFEVTAGTGKADMHDLLKKLGAKALISREEMVDDSPRVLLKEQWAGAVDQAGGNVLEYILRTTKTGGSVALTGNVAGNPFATTVLPFILRGVNLLGVDSQHFPMEKRQIAWDRLGGALKPQHLKEIATEITLEQLSEKLPEILGGGARGRYVVKLP